MTTRAQAAEIAGGHAKREGLGSGEPQVLRLDEITGRRPCVYTNTPLERCWIAYLDRDDDCTRLESSVIVVVDMDSGSVVYAGSAMDEG